jgi:threonine dehydrogenase-like Zn-dependent dehydrogenase
MNGVNRLSLRQVDDPICGPDEIITETDAVSICSTDVSYFRGHLLPDRWPVVPGHEYLGRVVEVGGNLTGQVRRGDRVTYWGQTDFDGLAEYRVLRPLFAGAATRETRWHTTRGFSDAHQAAAVLIPPAVEPHQATLVEPLTSVLRMLMANPPRPGDTAIVLGAGPSGLLATQVLYRYCGAGTVVVLDHNLTRLESARRVGAQLTFDPVTQRGDIDALIRQRVDSFADLVIDALPNVTDDAYGTGVRTMAMRLLRPEGQYIIFGATSLTQSISTWLILAKGLRIGAAPFDVRSFPMARTAHVIRVALTLITSGVIDVAPLVTDNVAFTDEVAVRAAFSGYGDGASMKTLVDFSASPPPRAQKAAAPPATLEVPAWHEPAQPDLLLSES